MSTKCIDVWLRVSASTKVLKRGRVSASKKVLMCGKELMRPQKELMCGRVNVSRKSIDVR